MGYGSLDERKEPELQIWGCIGFVKVGTNVENALPADFGGINMATRDDMEFVKFILTASWAYQLIRNAPPSKVFPDW